MTQFDFCWRSWQGYRTPQISCSHIWLKKKKGKIEMKWWHVQASLRSFSFLFWASMMINPYCYKWPGWFLLSQPNGWEAAVTCPQIHTVAILSMYSWKTHMFKWAHTCTEHDLPHRSTQAQYSNFTSTCTNYTRSEPVPSIYGNQSGCWPWALSVARSWSKDPWSHPVVGICTYKPLKLTVPLLTLHAC